MTTASPQAVYLEHESWLRTVVRSRLHEPDAVEDVMQNIALAIVKQGEILNQVNRIPAWLYQIAVRQVLMYRRSSGRRRKMHDRVAADPAARGDAPVSPLDGLLASETQENIQKALGELPEIERQILMLKYAEGWSYKELASHLGVQEDTVEYRLLRARKNFRRLLVRFDDEGLGTC